MTFKLRSGNKPLKFKMMGSSPMEHKKDGSWRGHEHKSLLGKLSGTVAEGIGGIKDRYIKRKEEYEDYTSNKNPGESRREFKIRREAESDMLDVVESVEEKVESKDVSNPKQGRPIAEYSPTVGLMSEGVTITGDVSDVATAYWESPDLAEENIAWGEKNPDLIKKDIKSGELSSDDEPWVLKLSFINADGSIREPGHDDRFTPETQKTGTSEGTKYGIGEWKDFSYTPNE